MKLPTQSLVNGNWGSPLRRFLKSTLAVAIFSLPSVVTCAAGVVVGVSPTSASVGAGGSTTLTATVTGAPNTAVVWKVDGIVNGNSTVGTIAANSVAPVVRHTYYTAETKIQTGVSVMAGDLVCVGWIVGNSALGAETSCSDSSGNTYTEVGGTGSSGYSYSDIAGGTMYQFYTIATSTNPSMTVTISSLNTNSLDLFVSVVGGMSPNQATVLDAFANGADSSLASNHATGTVTTSSPNALLFTLWGNDQWNGTLTETSGFTIAARNAGGANAWCYKMAGTAGSYSDSISTSPAMVQLSILAAFKCAVGNTVTYTAPATGGSHTITATSVADTTQSATATVAVSSGIDVSLSPTSVSLGVGSTTTLTATVTGAPNTAVVWKVDGIVNGNSTVGTIAANSVAPVIRHTYYTAETKIQTGVSVMAGDLVCVGWIVGNSALGAETSCSDSSGNTYTEVGGTGSSGYSYSIIAGGTMYQFYTIATSTNPSMTVTISSLNTNSLDLFVSVVGGMSPNQATVLDAFANGADSSLASNHATGTVTTSSPNALLFTLWGNDQWNGTLTETSGFTIAARNAGGANAWCYKMAATAGSYSDSISTSPAMAQLSILAAFKCTGGNTVTYTAPATGGSHTIMATSVADNSKSASAVVTVAAPEAPVLGSAPHPVFQPGVPSSFTLPTATDPAGSNLSYQVSGLPTGLAFTPSNLVVSGSISSVGTYIFSYTVTNGLGLASTGSITITVANRPVLGASPHPVSTPGGAVNFTLPTATDPSGATLTYQVSGLPAGLTFNPSNLVVSGSVGSAGTYSFSYTVTDGLGLASTGSITVTVANPPVLGVSPNAVFRPGVPSSLTLPIATDPSGSALSYRVSGMPVGLTFNPSNLLVSGSIGSVGTYSFSYTVTNGLGLASTGSITFTVAEGPVLGASPNPASTPGGPLNFALPTATDPSGTSLTYQVSGIPAGLAFAPASLVISGSIGSVGTYTFSYTVTDGLGLASTGSISVTVANPPILGASPTLVFRPGVPFSFALPTATDPSGTTLRYEFLDVVGLPAGLAFNPSNLLISGSIGNVGTYSFSYTVTNGLGLASTGFITLAVAQGPVLGTPPHPVFRPGVPNSFTLPTATDPSGSALSYAVSGLPAGLTFTPSGLLISGSIGSVGTYPFSYTVTDSLGLSLTGTITITVASPPVLGVSPTPLFLSGVLGSFTLPTATDPAGSSLSYQVSGLPDGLTFTSSSRLISGSISSVGTYLFIYTVTNGFGLSTSSPITLTVAQKPVINSFTASPSTITNGAYATLTWSVQGATTLEINGQGVEGSSLVVSPSETTSYTLVATNLAGTTTSGLTIKVMRFAWKKDILYMGSREVAEVDSQGINVTLTDHLGSPRLERRADGTVVEQKYTPFGETLTDSTTQGKFAKGFTNHEKTDASGLIYMQARFYLPMYGRFASQDPARDQHFEQTQSWNIYSYVQNNPVWNTDPSGMVIEITGHRVGKIGPYHTALRFTPDNQDRYKNIKMFKNVDQNKKHFATLSAGPSNVITGGMLTKAINKDTDILDQKFTSGPLLMPIGKTEDQVFDELLKNFNNYKNNLTYNFFPVGQNAIFDPDYNSNSFISGLTESVSLFGIKLTITPFGWKELVPAENFKEDSSKTEDSTVEGDAGGK